MSKAEILDQLWHRETAAGPIETEKALLNEAQTDYEADAFAGKHWREVEARLRRK